LLIHQSKHTKVLQLWVCRCRPFTMKQAPVFCVSVSALVGVALNGILLYPLLNRAKAAHAHKSPRWKSYSKLFYFWFLVPLVMFIYPWLKDSLRQDPILW
jgi:hypothetical protein